MKHLNAHKITRLWPAISKSLLLLLTSLLIIAQTACQGVGDTGPVEEEGYYLDTVCRISVYEINGGLDKDEAEEAIDAAYERCRVLDKTLSNTTEAGEVSRINAAGGAWTTVGEDTLAVIQAGLRYGELSDGAFDITIGTVTELWDFHADDPELPAQADIETALQHVDYQQVAVDAENSRVRLLDPEAKLDLGGIAKGYIADELAEVLEEAGVTSAIVNLGGNIVAIGSKPDGSYFTVGVERPYSDRSALIGSTPAEDETVVTSGVYERQFEVDGKIYHHILNSRTGYPADTDLEAVTLVMAKGHSMDADAMSTIALILGADAGRAFIEEQEGVEAVFCDADDEITRTDGMDFTEE